MIVRNLSTHKLLRRRKRTSQQQAVTPQLADLNAALQQRVA